MNNPAEMIPHLVAVTVEGKAEPRGKIIPANGEWILLRDVKAKNIITINRFRRYRPPGALSLEPAVADHLVDLGIQTVHYRVGGFGLLGAKLTMITAQTPFMLGGRVQHFLPLQFWKPVTDSRYPIPKIPDHLVFICGQQIVPGTGYGPGTDGGTKEGVKDIEWPTTNNPANDNPANDDAADPA